MNNFSVAETCLTAVTVLFTPVVFRFLIGPHYMILWTLLGLFLSQMSASTLRAATDYQSHSCQPSGQLHCMHKLEINQPLERDPRRTFSSRRSVNHQLSETSRTHKIMIFSAIFKAAVIDQNIPLTTTVQQEYCKISD